MICVLCKYYFNSLFSQPLDTFPVFFCFHSDQRVDFTEIAERIEAAGQKLGGIYEQYNFVGYLDHFLFDIQKKWRGYGGADGMQDAAGSYEGDICMDSREKFGCLDSVNSFAVVVHHTRGHGNSGKIGQGESNVQTIGDNADIAELLMSVQFLC